MAPSLMFHFYYFFKKNRLAFLLRMCQNRMHLIPRRRRRLGGEAAEY